MHMAEGFTNGLVHVLAGLVKNLAWPLDMAGGRWRRGSR